MPSAGSGPSTRYRNEAVQPAATGESTCRRLPARARRGGPLPAAPRSEHDLDLVVHEERRERGRVPVRHRAREAVHRPEPLLADAAPQRRDVAAHPAEAHAADHAAEEARHGRPRRGARGAWRRATGARGPSGRSCGARAARPAVVELVEQVGGHVDLDVRTDARVDDRVAHHVEAEQVVAADLERESRAGR